MFLARRHRVVALPYFEHAKLAGRAQQEEYIAEKLMAVGVPAAALGKM